MKRLISFFLAVIGVAGLSTFCTLRWSEADAAKANELDAHAWLHRELRLNEAQHAALEPIEAKFAEKRHQLAAELHLQNATLARLLAEDKAYSRRVVAQVEMVHHSMGDLQKASIEHLFEMRAVLTPEQGDKLLNLAQRTLEQSP